MFENKNIIVGKSNHVFTNLYIDMLIHNCHIHPDNLGLITLDDEKNTCLPAEHDIFIDYYKNYQLQELSTAKTITFISLNAYNSFLIQALLDFSGVNADKIYIHLTEDELSRWKETHEQYGEIRETKKNSVSSCCLSVLPRIKHFIASEQAFRPEMEILLKRTDFTIVDARDAFSVMPVQLLNKFRELYSEQTQHTQPENKILIGAKRGVFKYLEIISFLRALDKAGILRDYKYMIFTYEKRKFFRVMIDLYCLYLRHIRKTIIDISYPTVTNSVTYNALLVSCSHIILQPRGSMTSVKEFIKMGRGVVHVEKDTRNHLELTLSVGVDVAAYSDPAELAENIKNNHIDIHANQLKVTQRFKDSFAKLNALYK
ncbi:hypothetical protein VA7868_03689 [Vibrio aerogenes CECT 7868]|uniref:Capsule polysaccharide biosynthesis protein n=1 Tax=Vibrio aerogenes CECT 7868 TaxID=1216006 RepID=A0A1M6B1Y9_9VIBR|nr:hypothetical protein [Vibrio aerogenes]SHI42700.1 hypothetical protein VA7868_03689 [Vibrio aerogenes CECT 7868]